MKMTATWRWGRVVSRVGGGGGIRQLLERHASKSLGGASVSKEGASSSPYLAAAAAAGTRSSAEGDVAVPRLNTCRDREAASSSTASPSPVSSSSPSPSCTSSQTPAGLYFSSARSGSACRDVVRRDGWAGRAAAAMAAPRRAIYSALALGGTPIPRWDGWRRAEGGDGEVDVLLSPPASVRITVVFPSRRMSSVAQQDGGRGSPTSSSPSPSSSPDSGPAASGSMIDLTSKSGGGDGGGSNQKGGGGGGKSDGGSRGKEEVSAGGGGGGKSDGGIGGKEEESAGGGCGGGGMSDGGSGGKEEESAGGGAAAGGKGARSLRSGPVSWGSLALLIVTGGGILWYYDREKKRRVAEVKVGPAVGTPAIGGPFTLVNHEGKRVSEKDFESGNEEDGFKLFYFGFTFCPDICPEELRKLAEAVDIVEKKARLVVTPIFVSVDPERDTVELVREYVKGFHPRMIGLTGSPEEVKKMAQAYRVYYMKTDEKDDAYMVDHSIVMYLMDPGMKFVKFFGKNYTTEELAKGIIQEVRAWKKK